MTASEPGVDVDQQDLVVRVCDDPAYFALLDPDAYDVDMPRWDLDTLSARIVEEMRAGRIVAWGCPEATLQVRVTTRPLTAEQLGSVVATFTAPLATSGRLCLAGYTSLTMCAQFAKHRFPQGDDHLVAIAPGRYLATVHRRYAYQPGAQDVDGALPEGDHVIIVLTPGEAATAIGPTIPWTPYPG